MLGEHLTRTSQACAERAYTVVVAPTGQGGERGPQRGDRSMEQVVAGILGRAAATWQAGRGLGVSENEAKNGDTSPCPT